MDSGADHMCLFSVAPVRIIVLSGAAFLLIAQSGCLEGEVIRTVAGLRVLKHHALRIERLSGDDGQCIISLQVQAVLVHLRDTFHCDRTLAHNDRHAQIILNVIVDRMDADLLVEFADHVKLEDVKETLDRQIQYNTAISEVGLREHWGAQIGRVLMRSYGGSVQNRAKAAAAAASDARMSGCELPVVINSGSGNQGITCSLPVIVYAREIGVSEELLLRALVVSNLVTIHLKTGIGRLSAYCGATSAGCGAGAGITYLYGGKADEISHTVVNAIAIDSGMICDGAKASCAAKIASAVEAGLLGWQMQTQGSEFFGGDGIVTKGVENTIKNVGRVARVGMAGTDREIIDIMIRNC